MKLFFWVTDFLKAYAQLHTHQNVEEIVQKAVQRIQNYPQKYFWISIFAYAILEFIAPIVFGKVSRFSRLNKEEAGFLLEKLQNTKTYWSRLILILCKSPVLCALDECQTPQV